jgi:hypothetical protein
VRVPPPGSLRIDHQQLLKDLRERLAERIPEYADREDDPTDPGWLLMEQAAWLVEVLSEQLDEYPFSVIQQLVHIMGGKLRPARPALGIVVAEVGSEGVMKLDDRRLAPWRFFSVAREDVESIEFVPIESDVDLRQGQVTTVSEVSAGELFITASGVPAGIGGQQVWRGEPVRSALFEREQVRFTAVTNNVEAMVESLTKAVEAIDARNIGWLKLTIEPADTDRVVLVAEIDPGRAFLRAAPSGLAPGGDLLGDWGTLDGSTWTPVVRISDAELLPSHLHGQTPLPGYEDGQIVVMDVPENFPVAAVLERAASPVPTSVVEAIWRTLTNIDVKLAPIKPVVKVGFVEVEDDVEPTWVASAIDSGLWAALAPGQPKSVVHVEMTSDRRRAGSLRLGVVLDSSHDGRLPLRAFGLMADGSLIRKPLTTATPWRITLPPPDGQGRMLTVVAADVGVTAEVASVLLVTEARPQAILFNPILVGNLAPARDGRTVTVDRNVPIDISLLNQDLIDKQVIDALLEEAIPNDTAALLRRFPLAWFGVQGRDPIKDWTGVKLDPSEGTLTINSPNEDGSYRPFRPGAQLRLEWYRYTSGDLGNQPVNAIRLVEQPAGTAPEIVALTNPLPTFFGVAREAPHAAVDRMFGPAGGVPVLPADFEKFVRHALGSRADGWVVRCWTYAERSLVSSALWPCDESPDDAGASSISETRDALDKADSSTLFVVLGPSDGSLSETDLDWAQRTTARAIRRLAERLPVMRSAVVARYQPLELITDDPPDDIILPTFDIGRLRGTLRDREGREASVPRAVLLLNAAITSVSTGAK